MTAIARPVATIRAALLVGAVACWSITVVAFLAGIALPVPGVVLLGLLISIFVLPLLFATALFLGAARVEPMLVPLTAWMALLFTALNAALYVSEAPLVALVVPGVAVAAVLATRYRVGAVIFTFLLAGTFGSLTAFTPLRVGPLVDFVLAGLIVGALWSSLRGRRSTSVRVWPGTVVLGGFLLICAAGILLAPTLNWGLLSFRSAAWYLLAFILVAYLPWRPGELERVARGVVVVVALVAAYAVYRWIVGPAAQEWELAISSASIYNFVEGKLRAFGSFTSGHELGAWAAAMVPFCAAYALTYRDRWGALAAVAGALAVVAIFGSEVRIGVMAAVVGVGLVLVLYQLARGFHGVRLAGTLALVLGVATVGIAGFTAVVGDDSARADRYENIFTPDRDAAYQARLVKWRTAVAALSDKPFGNGLGTAGRVQRKSGRFASVASVNVDNAYLKIAWEQGYFVLALYVIGLVLLLGGLVRHAVATADPRRAGLAIGAAGTLAAFMVLLFAALYDEGLTALATWIVVGLGVGQFVRPATTQASPDSAYA